MGKGQFGQVYLGYLDGDYPVAIKMSNPLDFEDKSVAQCQLLHEIATLKLAGIHPQLVKLIGCCTLPENPVCVVLEYIEGGDLLAYLHRLRDHKIKKVSDINLQQPRLTMNECKYLSMFFFL